MPPEVNAEELNRYGETNPENPPFAAIAQSMFYGPRGWGLNVVCPRDQRMGCAFVDTLAVPQKGPANLFCSWVWTYPLEIILDAFRNWAETQVASPANIYVWICAFPRWI